MVSVCAQLTSCGACLGKYCFWLGLRDDSCMCTKQYNSSSPDFMWVLKPGSRCQDYTGLYCDSSFSSSSSPSYSTTELPVDPSYITTGHLFWIVVGALITFTMFLCCCISLLLKYHDRLRPIIAPISAWGDFLIEGFVQLLCTLCAGLVGCVRGIIRRIVCRCCLPRGDPYEEYHLNYGRYNFAEENESEDGDNQCHFNTVNPPSSSGGQAQNLYEEIPGSSFSSIDPAPSTSAATISCQQQQQQQQNSSDSSTREQPFRNAKLKTPGFPKKSNSSKKTDDNNK